jgi:hypothetical protein
MHNHNKFMIIAILSGILILFLISLCVIITIIFPMFIFRTADYTLSKPAPELYSVCLSSPNSIGCNACKNDGIESPDCAKCEKLFKEYVMDKDSKFPLESDEKYFNNEEGKICIDPKN